MPIMNFDLEDGKPPVSFSINNEGAERFMEFMAECQAIRDSVKQADAARVAPTGDQLRALVRSASTSASDGASPQELVLVGWNAAIAASAKEAK